jgi:dihydrofolate reductase
MGNVAVALSISLDGFITGPNDGPEHPVGVGGERLIEWLSTDAGAKMLGEAPTRTGAIVMGRRTYDFSATPRIWGEAGPMGQTPCFVVTHSPRHQTECSRHRSSPS